MDRLFRAATRSLCALIFVGVLSAQSRGDQTPVILDNEGGRFDRITAKYRARNVPPVDFVNSSRLDSLLRAGQLYLSLQDAIALAIENNLDVELLRFARPAATTDVERALGGGLLRGISTTLRELPQGVGGPGSPLLTTVGGSSPASTIPSSFGDLAAITATSNDPSVTGNIPLSNGTPLPVFDPALVGGLNWSHQTTPESSLLAAGVNPVVGRYFTGNFGIAQGFSTGTQINAGYNVASQDTNNLRTAYNPYTSASLGLTITQPLLQGFSVAVNRRFIRIGRNEQRIADYAFQQQLLETVSGIIRLYWDLVSLNEDVRVKQQALALAQRLYEDNKSQVEVGTLAPLELKRAQAEVARSRQDLTNSQSLVAQQEVLIKNLLTRNGAADPRIREAHIVPLDHIEVPQQEAVQPVQDLLATALDNRPDVALAGIQIENIQISLKGSRNELLPTLDLVGNLQNNALAGPINPLTGVTTNTGTPLVSTYDPFAGGTANLLSQLFGHNFPNYAVGLQLTIPLRNRVAQADVVRDEIQLRQGQVRQHQLLNQVRLEVENAVISLQRARADYEAAVETRQLQEEALAAEQERYSVGASTSFFVIQYQRDLEQARSTEVAAQGIYAKAKATLDRALGLTLVNNNVQLDEAYRGQISRPPSQLPVDLQH